MSQQTPLDKILFLDIETVPQTYQYEHLDEKTKELFNAKNRFLQTEVKSFEMLYNEKGGILSEFGKIVCISIGMIHTTTLGKSMRLKSFAHDDEETLLTQFKKLLEDHYHTDKHLLCGHNAKEFDFPYICRRMLINGIKLPSVLDIGGKKPWEIKHIDTMEMWKFGDYKAYTSLSLLCHVFKIPTPKDDITGADVARVYYEENDLDRIRIYCEKDVIALIQLYLKMNGEALISDGNISSAN
jgi:predicted PolB exonuclease-like 3'-5' exonuclease